MRKKIFDQIKKQLKNAKSAVIAVHVDPDGDAIGSSIALAMLLKKNQIYATIYSKDGVPEVYRFIPWADRIVTKLPLAARYDLAFMLDSSDLCRAGDRIDLHALAPILINIDHHPDNARHGDINYIEKISSVGEQIYQLAKHFKTKIDKEMAICLYVAMITDTGNFRYENTSKSTFLMAADLLGCGVKPHDITTRIYDTRTIPAVKVAAMMLSNIAFSADKKVAWSSVTHEMLHKAGATGENVVGLIDHLRAIAGVEVAVLFREAENKIKVNFRSKHNINVGKIAAEFGGGGHVKAAGAVIKGNLPETISTVIAAVKNALTS